GIRAFHVTGVQTCALPILQLTLPHFEDSDFYDKLTRARREASSRPLSLVRRTFGLVQNGISLVSYGILLWQFSPWAVLILAAAEIGRASRRGSAGRRWAAS